MNHDRHVRASRPILMALGTLLAFTLAGPPVAADNGGRRDPNDTPGRLDIARVAHGHDHGRLVHVIRTYRPWRPRHVNGDNRFKLVSVEDGDVGRFWLWRKNGRWWCKLSSPAMSRPCSRFPGVSIKHPGPRTLVVKSRRPAHWEGSYRWRAGSRNGRHTDWAPGRPGWIRHKLR